MNKSIKLLLPILLISGAAHAEDLVTTPESLWKASAELGYVATSGNTNTQTLNAKAMASNEREKWRHKVEVSALNASDKEVTTAEKYTFTGQSDYKLEKPNYLFGNIAYENDRFSGYEYRVSESIGYGRRVIDNTGLNLDLEIGPGARQSKLDDGTTQNEAMARAAARLNWAVSETSAFEEYILIESGEDVTVTKSVTSLSSQINGSLSMKVTYTYKYTSEVPVGIDDTDTETAITLVYNF